MTYLLAYPVIQHPDDGGSFTVRDGIKYLFHLRWGTHRNLTDEIM